MKTLPFIHEPSPSGYVVGDSEVGAVSITRMFDWTAAEYALYDNSIDEQAQVGEFLEIAQGIVSALNEKGREVSLKQVYQAMDAVNRSEILEMICEAGDDLKNRFLSTEKLRKQQQRRKDHLVATLMLKRVNKEWQEKDTEELTFKSPGLVLEIAKFGYREKAGWQGLRKSEMQAKDFDLVTNFIRKHLNQNWSETKTKGLSEAILVSLITLARQLDTPSAKPQVSEESLKKSTPKTQRKPTKEAVGETS